MTLRDLLRFIILACVFATPFLCLYVASNMFFPFITGKNFIFRILVEGMLGAWILLVFIDKTYRPQFSWILAAAGAFLVVMTIADLAGVNPYRSFWSNYERMEGLITIAHLFLYFIVAGTVLQREKIWLWFWRTSLGVSVIVAFYAFFQFMGRADIHQSSTRVDASFGNSAYLAVYALFHAFLSTLLFVRDRSGFRFVYPVITVFNIVVLYLTQTRGALLGLIGGSFLTLLLVAFFGKEYKKLRVYAMSGLAAIVLVVGLFIQFRDASWIQKNPTLQRMASISLSDSTTKSRFMIWQMSYEGFKEHPLFGWGQDNFLYVFSKYYNPKMWNQEPWFDRSHNVFFDWLVTGGALGLLTYLSMFGAILYYLWFRRGDHFSVIEKSIITGMLAGYFIHNIFVFDNLTSYIIFFGFLGYIHSLNKEDREKNTAVSKSSQKGKKENDLEAGDYAILSVLVIALTAGVIYFVNVRNMRANIALIKAIQPEGIMVADSEGNQTIALEEIISKDLFGTGEAREQLAQLAVLTLDPSVSASIREKFFNLTANEFEESLAKDPDNLRTQSFAALFYARFGQYGKALEHFEKAITLSPKRQQVYIDLALTYVAMGKYADAAKTAQIAYELEPKNSDARIAYLIALIYDKKINDIAAIINGHEDESIIYDSRILNALGSNGYYKDVVSLVNEKIARGFANGRDYFILAGGLAQLGDRKGAIIAVKKAISLDESLKEQGEQLIKEIQR